MGGNLEHYLQVPRPPIPDTSPLTPCQQLTCLEQDLSIRAVTPVYDLPEKYITGQQVIELTQRATIGINVVS